jgi:hypothetical protein
MKRRQILASTGAALAAGWIPGQALASVLGAGSDPGAVCAMHRMDTAGAACAAGTLRILAVQVAQAASALRRFDLDLVWNGEDGETLVQHAWQLRRDRSGVASAGSPLRMRLPGGPVRVAATIDGRPLAGRHEAVLEAGAVTVLASPRTSTGKPPRRSELLWDPATQALSLRDGRPRDFDAVVLAVG